MRVLLICCLIMSLLGWTINVQAQQMLNSTAAPSLPWYATVQLADHTFEIVVPGNVPGLTGVSPYQLTVGRYLTPRWAVQVGYTGYHFRDERTARGISVTGGPLSRYSYAESWAKAIPLLVRYRLTRNATHRMQFDGLLGATIVQYRDKYEVVNTTDGQVDWQNSWGGHTLNGYLTLGPAVSYRFSRHFEACFDFLLTKNLHSINHTFSTQQLNSTFGFQRGWNLGLRYRFSVKKRLN